MNVFHKYTLQTLKKNKTRTIVTIIGIILSVAMFSATILSLSSAMNYMTSYVEQTVGKFYCELSDVNDATVNEVKNDKRVKTYSQMKSVGYAEIGSKNEDKPYLYIGAVDKEFENHVAIRMLEGRMPEKSNEIALPEHLKSNGGVSYSIGDTLTLSVGQRQVDGEASYQNTEYAENEKLTVSSEITYTVVGIFERPDLLVEGHMAPGYTAYTFDDGSINTSMSTVFVTLTKMGKTLDFCEEYQKNQKCASPSPNMDLLRYNGKAGTDEFLIMLYGFGAFLILLIVFGSVSLIYNSFSISVSERTKQFGLLKSIGATKKQILSCVLFEAFFLCLIAIPIGLIAGCAGIGITLGSLSDMFNSILVAGTNIDIKMKLHVEPLALIAASLLSIFTTLISAYIPAKRAIKIPAIDAIRQSNDIKIMPGKVKTSKLTYKLFGFPGMIASKSFKRNRKRYRITILSLFMSIVLFISASSLCHYFTASFTAERESYAFDVSVQSYADKTEQGDKKLSQLYSAAKSLKGVEKGCVTDISYFSSVIDKAYLTDDCIQAHDEGTQKCIPLAVTVDFIDDEVFRQYLDENNIRSDAFFDQNNPQAIVYNFFNFYKHVDGQKYNVFYSHEVFKTGSKPSVICVNLLEYTLDGSYYAGEIKEENGKVYCQYAFPNEDGTNETKKWFPLEEVSSVLDVKIGYATTVRPFFIGTDNAVIVYPKSVKQAVLSKSQKLTDKFNVGSSEILYLKTSDHIAVSNELFNLISELEIKDINVYDYAENARAIRALILIIRVFSYGFITLISLIAAANVFNTISTGINLRRREFAMLKSVGMGKKGFNKMMCYESLLYGLKSLLFGLPVSCVMAYLMYMLSVGTGHEIGFTLPWSSIAIAVISVFAVVFSSMIYSMRKIKKENTVDALKNENI
ncbi:MAG: ABC transporter permease [Acutalibacteraceae bacterium]